MKDEDDVVLFIPEDPLCDIVEFTISTNVNKKAPKEKPPRNKNKKLNPVDNLTKVKDEPEVAVKLECSIDATDLIKTPDSDDDDFNWHFDTPYLEEFVDVNQTEEKVDEIKEEKSVQETVVEKVEKIAEKIDKNKVPRDNTKPRVKPLHFECFECKRLFYRKSCLTSHLRLLHSPDMTYKCKHCDKAFKRSTELLRHEIDHTGDISRQCQKCKLVLSTKENYEKHIKTHEPDGKTYPCLVCERIFAKPRYLTMHMRLHTGYKPLKCDICNKRFSQSSAFTIHKRKHTGEKPFVCPLCGKSFSHCSGLINHAKTHAKQESMETGTFVARPKTDLCNHCGKVFADKYMLSRHTRIHTGEKPYKCDKCPKSFTQSGSLTEHIRIHTGERPFKCPLCSKSFVQSGTLRLHIKKHNNS